MSGEIMRAVLTQKTRTRKWRCYTTTLTPVTAGVPVSNTFQIDDGEYFLWTGLAINQTNAGTISVARIYNFKMNILRGNKRPISRIPMIAQASASPVLAMAQDLNSQSYTLLESNEIITVEVSSTYALVLNDLISVTFSGIAYRE